MTNSCPSTGLSQFDVDDAIPVSWTDDAIIRLHFLLLDDCAKLADPETPLDERLDILQWIYADPDKDDAPFSFVRCLALVGRSTDPNHAPFDAQEIRETCRADLLAGLYESLDRYPAWVREAFDRSPDHVSALLAKNPQRINEAVRGRSAQSDLFATVPAMNIN
jgi:hypothetical protein